MYYIIIQLCKKKKKNFFLHISLETGFSRDFPTLDGSDFYSTRRRDRDTPFHEKKENIEKNIFGSGKGGGPLKR